MGLAIGAAALDNAMLGNQQISAIMLGAQEVWSAFKLPEFDGLHALFGDKTKGYIEMYSSGTLTLAKGTYDLFVVGGGASGGRGGEYYGDEFDEYSASSGSGGGYTTTLKSQQLNGNYTVTIGSGGLGHSVPVGYEGGQNGRAGGATGVDTLITAQGGTGGLKGTSAESPRYEGGAAGNGGSGGSVSGVSSSRSSYHYTIGAGGSDGSNGGTTTWRTLSWPGGAGQGRTTRAFESADGVLYSGGSSGSAGYLDTPQPGGSGGGGNGAYMPTRYQKDTVWPTSGLDNSGGAGGAGFYFTNSGAGGSGIAIVRWGY